ncbi:MAG: type II toxin-antitoxin system VapC family toxin [Methylocystis sp.]|nr:type II toxin-antitoxin system VapC family toxin [Methylocystis sp.]
MLAVDTNVVVRLLTGDHPQESAKAKELFERETIFVALTVLLETEWVLRSAYGFQPARLVVALRAFAGLRNVVIQDPPALAKALAWAERGMDFADALHLAQAGDCDGFASFDGRLAKAARRAGAEKAVSL